MQGYGVLLRYQGANSVLERIHCIKRACFWKYTTGHD